MSWKNVLSIFGIGVLLGLPSSVLAHNNRHDNDDRGDRRGWHDNDDRGGYHQRKKAERDSRYEAHLVGRYAVLAGSVDNARSLVKGLHKNKMVSLTLVTTTGPVTNPACEGRFPPPDCGQTVPGGETTETVSFDPPTRPMGYKGVSIALMMMEAKLNKPAMVAATPREIEAALVGPNGILTLRAQKKTWYRIARMQGFTVHGWTTPTSNTGKQGKHDDDDDDDD
jgi:hypothetical protein